jgi:hypothetical protein
MVLDITSDLTLSTGSVALKFGGGNNPTGLDIWLNPLWFVL